MNTGTSYSVHFCILSSPDLCAVCVCVCVCVCIYIYIYIYIHICSYVVALDQVTRLEHGDLFCSLVPALLI